MDGPGIDMDFVSDAESALRGDMAENMVRMVPDRFFLQKRQLPFQRRFAVDPQVALMADGVCVQLADIFLFARGMGHVIGWAVHAKITVKRLRLRYQALEFVPKFRIGPQRPGGIEIRAKQLRIRATDFASHIFVHEIFVIPHHKQEMLAVSMQKLHDFFRFFSFVDPVA